MKIYICSKYDYSDQTIEHVFESEDDAKQWKSERTKTLTEYETIRNKWLENDWSEGESQRLFDISQVFKEKHNMPEDPDHGGFWYDEFETEGKQ